ncbi:hypothetical protein EVJ58_g1458 [Rhodofomes roseus]|uniref:Uncharacterized protein n=1 Tax=Rhodofomes roseus TaxID=34475 RepID=A0A4Y9Z179_9APHY|nr:hypothetical protein EVJ58_g1458 [Rhodofomes roseus]
MTADAYRSHWVMVDRVAKDKLRHQHSLSLSDHYWLMRMDIEALKTRVAGVDSALPDTDLMRRIEANYAQLRQHPSANVHVPYLQAIFSSPVALHVQLAVKRLWELLAWLLDSSHEQAGGKPTAQSDRSEMTLVSVSGPQTAHLREPTNSIDLVPFLQNALFVRPNTQACSTSKHGMSSWALSVARTVFTPDHLDENSLEHRWNCFLLLAVASSPGRNGGASITNSYARWGAVVDWQTICALASLHNAIKSDEQPLDVSFSDAMVQSLGKVLGGLWYHWSSLPGLDHAARPRVATRAICASFMHLAGRFKNRRVVEDCRQLSAASRLWEEESGDAATSPSLRSLAQEQLVALLLTGSHPEMATSVTLQCLQEERVLTDVYNAVIGMFASEDVMLASDLRDIAQRVGIPSSTDTSVELALQLAKQSDIARAKGFLSDAALSFDQRLRVLHEILAQLIQRGHRFRCARFTPDVVDAMLSHLSSPCPPPAMRSVLETVLLYMPRFQHSKAAVTLVEAVLKTDKSYFSRTFPDLFIRSLLRHRQFRHAKRTHELARGLRVRGTPSSEWLASQLSNHGSSTLAKKIAKSSRTKPGVPDVARVVKFKEAHPSRSLVYKLPSLLRRRRLRDSPSIHRALEVLVRAGRIRAVKQLYSELHESQSPNARIAIGNSILHQSMQHPTRSQVGRGVKTLRTLTELVDQYGFVPDRVTVNVLVKAYMEWTAGFTNEDLRALFDHFVRIGYPTGGGALSGVPFGTAEGPPPVYLPAPKSPLSFRKHARPLYKNVRQGVLPEKRCECCEDRGEDLEGGRG